MILETQRLILRAWEERDAESLYKYAKDENVGPSAGWLPHTSVKHSTEVIQNILSAPETYALVIKGTTEVVGSVSIMGCNNSTIELTETEAEIGCWLGVPYWGQGLIPEAVNRLLERCFIDLGYEKVWYGYFDGNTKSKRVAEKCGFKYSHAIEETFPAGKHKVNCLYIDKDMWLKEKSL